MRTAAVEMINFKLADSRRGIELFRNIPGGFQRVKDTTIVAESPNVGK